EVFQLASDRALELWERLRRAGRPYDMLVTGPIVDRAVEKGVTDTAYYSNSNMNPYEAGHDRLVDLDKSDFIGRKALRAIVRAGPRRKTVGLFIDGALPRLEWYWPLVDQYGRPGEVRWAIHSFALDRSIGIALVDAAVAVGDRVQIHHPLGSPMAT